MIDKLVEMNLSHPVTSRVQYARRGEAEGGRMDLIGSLPFFQWTPLDNRQELKVQSSKKTLSLRLQQDLHWTKIDNAINIQLFESQPRNLTYSIRQCTKEINLCTWI